MLASTVPETSSPLASLSTRAEVARSLLYADVMSVEHLPPAPEIATAALAYLERDDCNVGDLAAFIASDQAIAASVLRLANSASFGMRGRMSSVSQAVTRLGFAQVRNLLLGLSVWHSFAEVGDSAPRYALWAHSALVSGTARALAQRAGRDGTEAYAGGLLHDIGKLVFGLRLGSTYWDLVADAGDDATLAEIEEGRFGCHHGTVGSWLLRLWHLPATLAETAARHHERLLERSRCTSTLVALADGLIDGTDPDTGRVDPGVFANVTHVTPGLLTIEEWPVLYANILGDQRSIADLF
jgi:putative nucleotidyltransferase with HDIG domain